MKIGFAVLTVFALYTHAAAAPLDVTISGEAHGKVKLETLSPNPDIPNADELTFSLDGGKSAVESEVIPLSIDEAVKEATLSNNTRYGLPMIPAAPFIAQALPFKNDPGAKRKALPAPPSANVKAPYWEFRVVDENDRVVYEQKGENFPVPEQSWDGMADGQFILNPNRAYVSFIVIHSSGVAESWPGEAFRFMSVLKRDEEGAAVLFSSRVYKKDRADFRDEAKLYLEDAARLLSLYPSSWTVTLAEPASDEILAEARRRLWKTYLEKSLGRKFADDRITVKASAESGVEIMMPGVTLKDEPLMHGKISPPVPHLESTAEWISVRENEQVMMIEMQHDRLFLPGSAYLRDAALPQLAAALARVRAERDRPPFADTKKNKKKEKEPVVRRILLRSYTESPRDKKRDKQFEDPKLAALRSKVLFNLFARERFLP